MKKTILNATEFKEKRQSDDNLLKELYSSTRKVNEFKHSIEIALGTNSKECFLEAYKKYWDYLATKSGKEENKKDTKDRHVSISKTIAHYFLEFINSDKFKEQESLNYANVLDGKLSPRIVTFLLWTQDKKEACFPIFKKNEVQITESEYQQLMDFLQPQKQNRNLPFRPNEEREYLEMQKTEFFWHQKSLKLMGELESIPERADQKNIKKTKL